MMQNFDPEEMRLGDNIKDYFHEKNFVKILKAKNTTSSMGG